MTTQDIIRQTKSFTAEQKQELAYYFLLSTMSEAKKRKFANLFHYKDDVEELKQNKKPLDNFMKTKGILKDIDLSDITEENIYLQND